MSLDIRVRAATLLHGALACTPQPEGWVRPERFFPAQVRALGSSLAWHPGLYRQMAGCTAGVSLEFVTDASRVEVEIRLDPFPRGSRAMIDDVLAFEGEGRPEPPFDGAGVEVDGEHLGVLLPTAAGRLVLDLPAPAADGPSDLRRVRVFLPCLTGCALRDVLADGSCVLPVDARPRLLVLGDSISQGFVACDPSLGWTVRLADLLHMDVLNQGVGGQVFQPSSLAGLAGAVDASAVVVQFAGNYRFEPCQASAVRRDVRSYLRLVSDIYPETPTWVVTALPHLEARYPTDRRSCFAEVGAIVAEEAAAHPQMSVVDGSLLLDARRLDALLADGSDHPGPLGQEEMALSLARILGVAREPGDGPDGVREEPAAVEPEPEPSAEPEPAAAAAAEPEPGPATEPEPAAEPEPEPEPAAEPDPAPKPRKRAKRAKKASKPDWAGEQLPLPFSF